MKIKPKKIRMNKTDMANYYERLCSAIAYVSAIATYEAEAAVRRMRVIARDEELLHLVKLMGAIDNLDYVVKKQVGNLVSRCSRCRVSTYPYITTFAREYASESRVLSIVHRLVHNRCIISLSELDAKAAVIALNSPATKSKSMLMEAYVTTSWSRIAESCISNWLKKWNAIAVKGLTLTAGVALRNQARSLGKQCVQLSAVLGDTPYDAGKPMWQQYHAAEDNIANDVLSLMDDKSFNKKVAEETTRDWMSFYIGSVALEYQRTGNIPQEVSKEVQTLDKALLLPFGNMIRAAANKVETTDDPYDFVDYIQEHKFKAYNNTIHKAIEFVNHEYAYDYQVQDA